MKVLVCGGRSYTDLENVRRVLDEVHKNTPITQIIEGGARGADALGKEWARDNNIPVFTVRADWEAYGKSASYIRNKLLLKKQPNMVVAFPGGVGTQNMISLAQKSEIDVVLGE